MTRYVVDITNWAYSRNRRCDDLRERYFQSSGILRLQVPLDRRYQ